MQTITLPRPDEHQKAGADLADDFIVDSHHGVAHALYDRAHQRIPANTLASTTGGEGGIRRG